MVEMSVSGTERIWQLAPACKSSPFFAFLPPLLLLQWLMKYIDWRSAVSIFTSGST